MLSRSGDVGVKILGALLIAAFVGIVGYRLAYPTLVYRFRITVNVETPQGLKTGSSVMEVRHISYPAWTTLGNNTGVSRLIGEAVFVDLGAGDDGRQQNLVALLALGKRGEMDLSYLPQMAFAHLLRQKAAPRGTAYVMSQIPVGTRVELVGELVPSLITFLNIDDPNTGRPVSPDNLSGLFGPGARLHAALEIVDSPSWPLALFGLGGAPLTRGIAKHLRWLDGPNRPAVTALKAAGFYLGESELAFRRMPQ